MNSELPIPITTRRFKEYYALLLSDIARGGPTYDEAVRDFQRMTLRRWPI